MIGRKTSPDPPDKEQASPDKASPTSTKRVAVTRRRPSVRARRVHLEEEGNERRLSVREVIRLFEEANKGAATVLIVKKKQNNGLILVRRKESVRSPAKLSLPRDNTLLDKALESKPNRGADQSEPHYSNTGTMLGHLDDPKHDIGNKQEEVEDSGPAEEPPRVPSEHSELALPEVPSRSPVLLRTAPEPPQKPPDLLRVSEAPRVLRSSPEPPPSPLHRPVSEPSLAEPPQPPTSALYRLLARSTSTLATRNLPSVPDESQHDYELFNVYENSYAVIDEKAEEDIYDDVVDLKSTGVYEIVYSNGSTSSDSTTSVDQRNSIYGLRPSSASSGGGSDEWVDLESDIQKDKLQQLLECSAFKGGTSSENIYQNEEKDGGRGGVYESVHVVDQDSALCDDFSDDEPELDPLRSSSHAPHENGMRSKSENESIYCLIREAGRKTWSKGLHFISKFGGEEKSNGVKWLTLNKKNKRRHSVKSTSTFYIRDGDQMNPLDGGIKKRDWTSPPKGNRLSLDETVQREHLSRLRPTSPPPPPPIFNGNGKRGDSPSLSDGGVGSSPTSSVFYGDLQKSDWSERGSSHGSDINLRFADEPLYQFYEASVFEREKAELEVDEVSYEELDLGNSRPSALELVTTQLNRTLWCQVPQVIASNVLDGMTLAEKQVQEAKFEVMTSEASYYKSLAVLEKHFALSTLFKDNPAVLPRADYETLFANVYPVRKCSELVLNALDRCWQEDMLLDGLCKIISRLAEEQFHTYVTYCTNQVNIDRTIKKLRASNSGFVAALKTLEASDVCQSLSLSSFLLLPMQRITRMPLLLDAILTKLSPSHPEYQPCKAALALLNKIVSECNEAARQEERREEMAAISRALVFLPLTPLDLLSKTRWLVKSGQVTNINLEPRLTITKKLTSKNNKLTLFLFTDYLVVAKKKSEESYHVTDYCLRNLVQMSAIDEENSTGRHLVILTMLENHERKTVELVLCCGSESGRERWLSAVSSARQQKDGEVLYEVWDCPQVTTVHPFAPSQPDELPLRVGDTVNVLRKLTDGWYYGERMRDQQCGWFPANHTMEIHSAHVRARNLKQRYRLLALSNSYIQQQLNKK